MKIWYQSSVEMTRAGLYSDALNAHFHRIANPGTEVHLMGAKPGTWGDLQPANLAKYPFVFHKIIKNIFIDAALDAEKQGYDAFVLGSSTDPALREVRSLVDIPVVSALEASVLVSCTVAQKTGLIAPLDEIAHILRNNITEYGLNHQVVSCDVLDAPMADDDLNALFSHPDEFLAGFSTVARRQIARGADAIIPAEGIMAEVVASNGLTDIDGARVIDPVGVGVAFAEMQVKLAQLTGLRPGRHWHYAQPPQEVITALLSR